MSWRRSKTNATEIRTLRRQRDQLRREQDARIALLARASRTVTP
ncbi:hypothetical protein [Actinoplanes sichuanensis]|uniref:Transposase n=1 Tax=Actinoplanes sichuanensis TaxID=512349 RepID=A0ABW4A6C9_9ACTN|nr:hypothetical protein [Actinoplanes sichuanensis]